MDRVQISVIVMRLIGRMLCRIVGHISIRGQLEFYVSFFGYCIAIRDHNCGNFSRLDYRTVVEVGETSIRVVFTSKGMRWMSVGVVVWVTARPDLYVGNIVG